MHLNTRSLLGNFDKLNLLLRNLQVPFSVIGVSETWLNDATSELVNITGYDNIPLHVVKHSFHLISAPLVDIINLSLLKGIFPDKLKIAKVIPVR